MSLTNQDIQAISALLDKQKKEIVSDTERKITTTVTNVNRESKSLDLFKESQTVSRLRDEILTSEENVKKILTKSITNLEEKMNKKFEKIDERFEKIDNRFDRVDESLTNISQELIEFIGEVEVDNRVAHKNFDTRLCRVEKNSRTAV